MTDDPGSRLHLRGLNRTRALQWTLRTLGVIDLAALIAVVMPRAWIELANAAAGLEPLPQAPLVGYLARSASAMYALHGLLVIYVSLDVVRYSPLIRFLALAAVGHGGVVLAIDVYEQMPLWWTLVEGPTFALSGLLVLAIQGRKPPVD